MPSNKKGSFPDSDLDFRSSITKVRGGWTEEKVKRELKRMKCTTLESQFYKEISKYDTPEEFAENLFYHGSANSISNLKPSIILKLREDFGGGSGDQYYGVSLSRDRNIASGFTGNARSGNVAPVLLKRGANVIKMENIKDSIEINDIITDLWTQNVDAVIIGDHTKEHSEQEIVVLNTRCLAVGKSTHFMVFGKKKIPSFSEDELEQMWLNSSEKYKELVLENWDNSNTEFKAKHGKEKDPATRWTSKSSNYYDYHQYNKEVYLENKLKKDNVKNFLKSKEIDEIKPNSTRKLKI